MELDCHTIRRHNLRLLVAEAGGQKSLAARTGVSAAYLCQVLSERIRRNMGHRLARRLEQGMDKGFGWMDRAAHATLTSPDQLHEGRHAAQVYGAAGCRHRWLRHRLSGGSLARLAAATGVDEGYLQQVATGHLPFGYALARRIETALLLPPATLEQPLDVARQQR